MDERPVEVGIVRTVLDLDQGVTIAASKWPADALRLAVRPLGLRDDTNGYTKFFSCRCGSSDEVVDPGLDRAVHLRGSCVGLVGRDRRVAARGHANLWIRGRRSWQFRTPPTRRGREKPLLAPILENGNDIGQIEEAEVITLGCGFLDGAVEPSPAE